MEAQTVDRKILARFLVGAGAALVAVTIARPAAAQYQYETDAYDPEIEAEEYATEDAYASGEPLYESADGYVDDGYVYTDEFDGVDGYYDDDRGGYVIFGSPVVLEGRWCRPRRFFRSFRYNSFWFGGLRLGGFGHHTWSGHRFWRRHGSHHYTTGRRSYGGSYDRHRSYRSYGSYDRHRSYGGRRWDDRFRSGDRNRSYGTYDRNRSFDRDRNRTFGGQRTYQQPSYDRNRTFERHRTFERPRIERQQRSYEGRTFDRQRTYQRAPEQHRTYERRSSYGDGGSTDRRSRDGSREHRSRERR
jgi:hypothetical protein